MIDLTVLVQGAIVIPSVIISIAVLAGRWHGGVPAWREDDDGD